MCKCGKGLKATWQGSKNVKIESNDMSEREYCLDFILKKLKHW